MNSEGERIIEVRTWILPANAMSQTLKPTHKYALNFIQMKSQSVIVDPALYSAFEDEVKGLEFVDSVAQVDGNDVPFRYIRWQDLRIGGLD